jgi:hypothetical protein
MKHCVHASQPLGPFIVQCAHPVAQLYFGERAHVLNCAVCSYCRPDPTSSIGMIVVEASGPPEALAKEGKPKPGLGDLIERAVKPIARALKSDCLDVHHNLKPDSGCAKRRDALNRVRLVRRSSSAGGLP